METHKLICMSFSRKLMYEWLMVIILGVVVVEVGGDENCPVVTGTLYAYPEQTTYEFGYTFDPLFKTNINFLDRLLTPDDDVVCNWVVQAKEGHTAVIQFPNFHLTPGSRTKHPDCIKIYDGDSAKQRLIEELCGGDQPRESYGATGRYMYLIYSQGEITGRRSFTMDYSATPLSKAHLFKIAGIICGTVAAVAVVFLAFKFTRNCRPCRKHCCPDQPTEEGTAHRELRPLTPTLLVPPSVVSTRGNTGSIDGQGVPQAGNVPVSTGQRNRPDDLSLSSAEEAGEDNGELSPPADEPPPSYDSIFGDSEDRNKPC